MEEQKIENTFVSMTEAGFSINFRMLDASGNEVTITMRGPSAADWNNIVKERREFLQTAAQGGWKPVVLRQAPAQPAPQQAAAVAQQTAPAQRPVGQPSAGGAHTFHATKLAVEFTPKGEKAAKLFGGNYQKYGVRLWPEVAATLGFDLPNIQPGEYQCDLQVAYAVNEEGKPQKIIGFAPGQAAPAPVVVAPQASHQAAGFGANDPDTTPF